MSLPDAKLIGTQQCIETGQGDDVGDVTLIAGLNSRCWPKPPPWGGLAGGGESVFALVPGGLAGGGNSHATAIAGGLAGGGNSHAAAEGGGLAGGGSSHAAELAGGLAGGGLSKFTIIAGGLAGGGLSHAAAIAGGLAGGGHQQAAGLVGGLAGGGHQQAAGLVGGLAGGGASTFAVITPGPARVQKAHSGVNNATSASTNVSWPAATTNGNLLVAIVWAKAASFIPSLTAPSGWVQAVHQTNVLEVLDIYYIKNASSQSSTGTWTANGASLTELDVFVIEYSGCSTTAPLITALANSGNNAAPVTSNTGTLPSGAKVIIGGFGYTGTTAFSAPTNSFAIIDQFLNNTRTYSGWTEKFTTSIATTNSGLTSAAGVWVANIVAFH